MSYYRERDYLSQSVAVMSHSLQKFKVCKKKKIKSLSSKENLEKLSQEELIARIMQLEAHNQQLKYILQKQNESKNDINYKVKKKIDFDKVAKRHVLLKFYYLGWDYEGFVSQENTNNTIEHFFFKALEKCCLIESREKSNYHRCGRTDKKVSAFSQVISLDLRSKLQDPNETNVSEELSYSEMLNRLLPDNIRCYSWCHVGSNTSARFDCSSRTYKYYFPKGDLNIQAMQEGSKFLVGVHDFRNFCKMDVRNGVTVFEREIKFVDIRPSASSKTEISGYQMFELIIQGKSFLWHQIRCIMNVLLLIGQGKESPNIIKELLNITANSSKPQYALASHFPLNLYSVDYENISKKWIVDERDLSKTIKLLQNQWTEFSIKSTLVKDLIENLQKLSEKPLHIENQADSLQEGPRLKVYVPLLSRMKCENLEDRINHYIKKRKLEIAQNSNSPT